jgi:hypothetical protein
VEFEQYVHELKDKMNCTSKIKTEIYRGQDRNDQLNYFCFISTLLHFLGNIDLQVDHSNLP